MWNVGLPDILGIIKGQLYAIELKWNQNKATPKQEYELQKIRDAGGETFICNQDTIDVVIEYLYRKGGSHG